MVRHTVLRDDKEADRLPPGTWDQCSQADRRRRQGGHRSRGEHREVGTAGSGTENQSSRTTIEMISQISVSLSSPCRYSGAEEQENTGRSSDRSRREVLKRDISLTRE